MFIKEYQNALSPDFCNSLIEKFDQDDRKVQGGTVRGVDLTIKDSLDLQITGLEGYEEFDNSLFESLAKNLIPYARDCFTPCSFPVKNLSDTGYQIQKTLPGSIGYVWHHDFIMAHGALPRVVTFIWYLNTVEEGGETEFITGEKIKPEQGKLVFFPATWTMAHRGLPPVSGVKYICTGWFTSPCAD